MALAIAPLARATPSLSCQASHPYHLIPMQALTPPQYFVTDFGTAKVQKAIYQGQNVVLKAEVPGLAYRYGTPEYARRKRQLDDYIQNEAYWQSWLNRFGMGRKFYGLTTLNEDLTLVLEQVPLTSTLIKGTDNPDDIESTITRIRKRKLNVTSKTVQQLDQVLNLLIEHLVMTDDLQFLLTENGDLVLIDSADFKFERPENRDKLISHYKRQRINFLKTLSVF